MTHCVNCIHYRTRAGRQDPVCARSQLRCDTSRAPGGDCYPVANHYRRAPLGFDPQPRDKGNLRRFQRKREQMGAAR